MATSCRRILSPNTSKSWLYLRAQRNSYSTQKLTNVEVRKKRAKLFDGEHQRQLALITRIEKIKVDYKGLEPCTLIMNKDLSTPFNCAMHLSQQAMSGSALALVDGQPWDLHRPLEQDCQLQLLTFTDDDPTLANQAFWRSCSFLLGLVLESALKAQHYVQLCRTPQPDIESGSFVYDADLDLAGKKLSPRDLDCLSRVGLRLRYQDLRWQRLVAPPSVARTMFKDNKFKSKEVETLLESSNGGGVTVYRVGDHIDLSDSPLISSTAQLGRFSVTAAHDVDSPSLGRLTRIQGLALPTPLMLHSWTYDNILRPRAAKLNTAPIPETSSQPLTLEA